MVKNAKAKIIQVRVGRFLNLESQVLRWRYVLYSSIPLGPIHGGADEPLLAALQS